MLLFVSSLVLINLSTANAMLSEAASLAITAAGGMLQEDDKKLEQDIIKGLSDDAQKQQLKVYVENTRPIIRKKSEFFNSVISPAFLWCMNTMPSVGNFLMGTVTSAYIMHYENQLEKNTDSDVLKKFIELREHNIDAGQGMFETLMDANDPQYDKNTSNTTLITDGTLIAAKGMQNYNRYKSSAAAIAAVLEAANIPMQPEDVGDICINQYVNSTNNKSVQLPPSEDATKSSKPKTSSQDNNKTESPPITQSAPSSTNNDAVSLPRPTSNATLGNVNLGDSPAEAERSLGNPTKKTVKEEGKLRYEYPLMDVAYDYGAVVGMAADDASVSTPKGIHASSSLQEVLNKYGSDYMLSTYDNLDLYEYKFTDENKRPYLLRFAIRQDTGNVKYISIRYVD